MRILIDADGVLENLSQEWVLYLDEKYGYSVKYEDLKEWDMTVAFPGLTREQVYGAELEEALYDRLKPMPGAPECVKRLVEAGHEIYVVTNTPYEVIKYKMEKVIFRYYPFLSWKNVIIASNKKMIDGDVLIDDGIHNLVGGRYEKILFDAPYNRDFDEKAMEIVRVRNWWEIDAKLAAMELKEQAAFFEPDGTPCPKENDIVRVVKVDREALYEVIYEHFNTYQEFMLADTPERCMNNFAIDWENGKFIYTAHKDEDANGKIIPFPADIDLQKLLRKLPATADSAFEPGTIYREYTFDELRAIQNDGAYCGADS